MNKIITLILAVIMTAVIVGVSFGVTVSMTMPKEKTVLCKIYVEGATEYIDTDAYSDPDDYPYDSPYDSDKADSMSLDTLGR